MLTDWMNEWGTLRAQPHFLLFLSHAPSGGGERESEKVGERERGREREKEGGRERKRERVRKREGEREREREM
jgi:hypothetical protein